MLLAIINLSKRELEKKLELKFERAKLQIKFEQDD